MTAPRADRVAPQSSFLTTPGAPTLHLLRWRSAGTPVLLLHGFGDHAWAWDDVAVRLHPSLAPIALDFRGHGDSDRDPERRYALPQFVDDVLTAVLSLGPGPVVLVGHSLGGRVAALFAARYAQYVSSLVLVDWGPELNRSGVEHLLDHFGGNPWTFAAPADYRRLLQATYPLATGPQLDQMTRHGLQHIGAGTFARKLDPAFADPGLVSTATSGSRREMWELLKLVDQPTIVVRGVASAMLSPAVAERMVTSALPSASLVVVPRAGHAVVVDNPDDLSQAVNRFLGRGAPA